MAITVAVNFCCRDAVKAVAMACYAADVRYSTKLDRRGEGYMWPVHL